MYMIYGVCICSRNAALGVMYNVEVKVCVFTCCLPAKV